MFVVRGERWREMEIEKFNKESLPNNETKKEKKRRWRRRKESPIENSQTTTNSQSNDEEEEEIIEVEENDDKSLDDQENEDLTLPLIISQLEPTTIEPEENSTASRTRTISTQTDFFDLFVEPENFSNNPPPFQSVFIDNQHTSSSSKCGHVWGNVDFSSEEEEEEDCEVGGTTIVELQPESDNEIEVENEIENEVEFDQSKEDTLEKYSKMSVEEWIQFVLKGLHFSFHIFLFLFIHSSFIRSLESWTDTPSFIEPTLSTLSTHQITSISSLFQICSESEVRNLEALGLGTTAAWTIHCALQEDMSESFQLEQSFFEWLTIVLQGQLLFFLFLFLFDFCDCLRRSSVHFFQC